MRVETRFIWLVDGLTCGNVCLHDMPLLLPCIACAPPLNRRVDVWAAVSSRNSSIRYHEARVHLPAMWLQGLVERERRGENRLRREIRDQLECLVSAIGMCVAPK